MSGWFLGDVMTLWKPLRKLLAASVRSLAKCSSSLDDQPEVKSVSTSQRDQRGETIFFEQAVSKALRLV